MNKNKTYSTLVLLFIGGLLSSCRTMFSIDTLPEDNYKISKKDYFQLDSNFQLIGNEDGKIKIEAIQKDNQLSFKSLESNMPTTLVRFDDVKKLSLSRVVLDFDVITIPFKIRPSVKGFLNK